jgi:hypothetical protein
MDLSGKIIQGTGSYKISEVAFKQELITNGDFSSGISGWNGIDCDISVVDFQGRQNVLKSVATNGATVYPRQTLTDLDIYVGGRFKISFWYYIPSSNISTTKVRVHHTNTSGANALSDIYSEKDKWVFVTSEFVGMQAGSGSVLFVFHNELETAGVDVGDVLYISNVSVSEIPSLPSLDKGAKYLECTSDGTVAIPSTQAYGEWEFDWYKGSDTNNISVYFICPFIDISAGYIGAYRIIILSTEAFYLQKPGNSLLYTKDSYIENNTWYRFKITRTLDGEFCLYIKGGEFGTNDWTLASVTGGGGSNPATDNGNTISNYFVLDSDSGDRFANLEMRNLVRQ